MSEIALLTSGGSLLGRPDRRIWTWVRVWLVGAVVLGPQIVPAAEKSYAEQLGNSIPMDQPAVLSAVESAMKQTVTGASNPFAVADFQTRLPYVEPDCVLLGEGPTHVPEHVTRMIIEHVFRSEGYPLDAHTFQTKDFRFQATGYNPKSRTGFVLVTRKNTNLDLYSDFWNQEVLGIAQANGVWMRENGEYVREKLAAWVEWQIKKESPDVNLKTEGRRLLANPSPSNVVIDYHAWRMKVEDDRLSLGETKKLEEEAVQGRQFVAAICIHDWRLDIRYFRDPKVRQQVKDIEKEVIERSFGPSVPQGWDLHLETEKRVEPLRKASQARLLEDFALTVREYIAWARRHGLK